MAREKTGNPVRYYKLGEMASMFYDPSAKNEIEKKASVYGLKISSSKLVKFKGIVTDRMILALRHGHIIEVKEGEEMHTGQPDTTVEDKVKEVDYESMTKRELVALFQNDFESSAEQLEEFSSKKKSDMIDYLTSD